MADTMTTTEAQRVLGLGSRRAARQQLARWGITATGRDMATGEKLWPADQVRTAAANRPGRGARTDLRKDQQ